MYSNFAQYNFFLRRGFDFIKQFQIYNDTFQPITIPPDITFEFYVEDKYEPETIYYHQPLVNLGTLLQLYIPKQHTFLLPAALSWNEFRANISGFIEPHHMETRQHLLYTITCARTTPENNNVVEIFCSGALFVYKGLADNGEIQITQNYP